ncbi:selenocysteine lyase/cysteine desulfurase [Deinobacterium chartae]|uniref:Selenocysteine lyase/cysteine desulfurase n=1 Tax=Deinobacterium chartae TaxID=521158 RepID=A0A841HYV3_9DEIO|nr:aminotransferase class V-fold PLP-dependent enzyme [Deinobacterium chartae]MBB6097082.1 selenocysteine lyase/cysteine desulfurase [Deinobacterium chartae]
MNLAEFRAQFPGLERCVHLANCSRGALSLPVQAAVTRYLEDWQDQGAPWGLWMQTWERARTRIAQLIGAQPHEIALTDSASSALGAAARSLPPSAGAVVIEERSFPSAYYLADALTRDGYTVRLTRDAAGDTPLERAANALEGAATFLIAHLSFQTGELIDPAPLVALARAAGARVALDGYQALGVVPTDVAALDVDLYLSGSHKYLLGLEGFAFLYVREGLEVSPAAPGWMAADDPLAMNTHARALHRGALRFQTGTPNVAGAYALDASLDLLSRLDPAELLAHVRACVRGVMDTCHALGLEVITPLEAERHAALVSILSPDASAAAASLQRSGIVCSPRGPALRVSFHAYNHAGDLQRVCDWIAQHPHHFRSTEVHA